METTRALIERLTLAAGPSGYEGALGAIIREELGGIGRVTTDPIGNILCEVVGTDTDGPTVVLAAHQDEIGFMVSEITDDGFIRFTSIGGWNTLTLPSSPVEIMGKDNVPVPGIIGQISPHFLKKGAPAQVPEMEELFIDIGAASAQEVSDRFGIALGSLILPVTRFHYDAHSGIIMSKAFDDRIGVAALVELGRRLAKDPVGPTVILSFTVQEEVGTRGAKVVANRIKADAAIVVEGAPADDVPGGPARPQTCIGKGAHLRIFDPTHIGHPGLLSLARSVGRKHSIVVQEAVRKGGGTDAMVLALADRGIPTIVTGIPVRYAHSHNCLVSLHDYRQLLGLLYALCQDMTRFG
ncbi:MAG: M42 family metallopeptidase [Sphaerochaetaceae bacterium]|jgi:endoglucanase|nr:M42 family metallopeptidase [Sphaerochaetaceae bacterium]MDD3940997.1 M42 family metallopeptidase [Sphaerochaetaceae bacterium]MDX9938811.1 M42 family metallopeptidase [Sphaerochaetaceae bacterium]